MSKLNVDIKAQDRCNYYGYFKGTPLLKSSWKKKEGEKLISVCLDSSPKWLKQ